MCGVGCNVTRLSLVWMVHPRCDCETMVVWLWSETYKGAPFSMLPSIVCYVLKKREEVESWSCCRRLC